MPNTATTLRIGRQRRQPGRLHSACVLQIKDQGENGGQGEAEVVVVPDHRVVGAENLVASARADDEQAAAHPVVADRHYNHPQDGLDPQLGIGQHRHREHKGDGLHRAAPKRQRVVAVDCAQRHHGGPGGEDDEKGDDRIERRGLAVLRQQPRDYGERDEEIQVRVAQEAVDSAAAPITEVQIQVSRPTMGARRISGATPSRTASRTRSRTWRSPELGHVGGARRSAGFATKADLGAPFAAGCVK